MSVNITAKKTGKNAYELFSGQKLVARCITAGKAVIFTWGKCSFESASDAIYLYHAEAKSKGLASKAKAERQEDNLLHVIARVARPVLVPQVIVTLGPSGDLQAELPSSNGTRRVIPLKNKGAVESLKRILQEQLEGNIAIGEDGDPTRHQVWHWESHQTFPDSRCIHCIKEGRIKIGSKRSKSREIISKTQDAEIRRIKAGTSGKDKVVLSVSSKNVGDLDL